MEAKQALIAVCLIGASARAAIAAIPPEIPHSRTSQVFSPFYFQFVDAGESVFESGGPECQDYSITEKVQTFSPVFGPSVFLTDYVNMLRAPSGILFASSHADSSGLFAVEPYTTLAAALAQAQAYTNQVPAIGTSKEIGAFPVSGGYYGIVVTGNWIQKKQSARHEIVAHWGCYSSSLETAFVNSKDLVRNYVGFNAICANTSTSRSVTEKIFNNMSGTLNDTGAYTNVPFRSAYYLAKSVFSPATLASSPTTPPLSSQIRLYNAPRIVLSQITQHSSGDLYRYQFGSTYPYNPNDYTSYPGSPGVSGITASTDPIQIILRFSEPMDTGWANFRVQLQFSDSSTQDLTGDWGTAIVPDDNWTSASTSFPNPVPNGKITVSVRARKVVCGIDAMQNQELDTTGSGTSSAPSYDTSATFRIDTSSTSTNDEDAERNQTTSTSTPTSQCLVGVVRQSHSGVASVSVSGPSLSSSTVFSCKNPVTKAVYGPFCQVSTGTYTISGTGCSGISDSTTTTKYAASNLLELSTAGATASGVLSEYLALNGELRVESCVVRGGGTCLDCIDANIYDQSTLQGGDGGVSRFCGAHSGGSGGPPNCCQRIYLNVGDAGFSVVNLGSATVSYELSLLAQVCIAPNCGPNEGLNVSLLSGLTGGNGASTSGEVRAAQFGQRYPEESPEGKAAIDPPLADISISSSSCPGTPSLLAKRIYASLACYSVQGSEAVFTSTTNLTLTFQDTGSVVTDTTTLAIYQYQYENAAWSTATVTNQTVVKDTTTGVITASGEYLRTGIFGAFFPPADSSAPITTLSFQGSTRAFAGDVFVSTDAYLVLASTDPTVNGYASQSATTYYRIDATTANPSFSVYTTSIPLSIGFHIVDYRAIDWAGNWEQVKTSTFLVTAGTLFKTSSRLVSKGSALIGFLDSGAQLEVESRAENSLTLNVSSVNTNSMLAVDNIGNVGLGEAAPAARLDVQGSGSGTALALRSGNSIASTSSVQIAFGYNGETSMRHALVTTHSTDTVGNRMDFYIWNALAPSTSAIASMDLLALQVSTNASGGVFHVRPVGNPIGGVELIVSDGVTPGAGKVVRADAVQGSSRRVKSDISYLSLKEEQAGSRDLLALKHVRFNYKSEPVGARPHTGILFEEAPASVRGPGDSVSLDDRLNNAEMSFKEALRRIAAINARLAALEAPR